MGILNEMKKQWMEFYKENQFFAWIIFMSYYTLIIMILLTLILVNPTYSNLLFSTILFAVFLAAILMKKIIDNDKKMSEIDELRNRLEINYNQKIK